MLPQAPTARISRKLLTEFKSNLIKIIPIATPADNARGVAAAAARTISVKFLVGQRVQRCFS